MVDNVQVFETAGSKGKATAMSLAKADDLAGVDILTWPALSPIWPPPPDAVRSEWFDLSSTFRSVAPKLHCCLTLLC